MIAAKAEAYQKHLNLVSRSFAFCIEELGCPFRQWVALSYLLCRIVDTIEDAPWENIGLQRQCFQQFRKFLQDQPTEAELLAWRACFPAGIVEAEEALLKETGSFLTDLRQLPQPAGRVLHQTLNNMIQGMEHFSGTRFEDLATLELYCFFVAGIVGELLTELFLAYSPISIPKTEIDRLYRNGVHFGLFLQKVNVLKDQKADERSGRFFIADRSALRASLQADARAALRYLLAIPHAARDYRIFCGWSLFLGLASLPWIERSFREKTDVKIPRLKAWHLLHRVKENIEDDRRLEHLFESLVGKEPLLVRREVSLQRWNDLYQGNLEPEDFQLMGLAR
jgi:phytoene/squalene synthetase